MSDIVERLRIESEWYSERGDVDGERVTKEAADEIEELRKQRQYDREVFEKTIDIKIAELEAERKKYEELDEAHDKLFLDYCIERKRREAYWTRHRTLTHDGAWYCSACETEYPNIDTVMLKPKWRYCPNCGAKMDEVAE